MTHDYQTFTTKDTPKEERRRLNVGDIWSNAAECTLCGDVVRSTNRHDCRSCKCGAIAVDGGSDYARRIGDQFIDRTEMYDDVKPSEEAAQ